MRSGVGKLLSGGGLLWKGAYGAVPPDGGLVVVGAGTTGGPVMVPAGAVKPGGVTGPPTIPGAAGVGLHTPPNDPAAFAGGLAGKK